MNDTIAALASAPGSAARGIIRISGAGILQVLNSRFQPADPEIWGAARISWSHRGVWKITAVPTPMPVQLHLWPSARSYTGEPLAELHTVSSPPLLDAVLEDLYAAGARPARAGEFTLRAFLAGKIDLVQAEAVLGVIDADGPGELRTALEQLAGGLSGRIGVIRHDLLDLLAELEAGLDFAEEGIEFVSRRELIQRITAAETGLAELLAQAGERTRAAARVRIVLTGPANAGKSTLFNALADQPLALVSRLPGTTRDYLRAELDWDGLAIELIDTPGWESTSDALLQQAFALREDQLRRADFIVHCVAADQLGQPHSGLGNELLADLSARQTVLKLLTKADLLPPGAAGEDLRVSALTGTGLEPLRAGIMARISNATSADAQLLGMTAARCRESLSGTCAALNRARSLVEMSGGEELIASDLREGLDELGKVTGMVYTDDILDRVFSKFCIGK